MSVGAGVAVGCGAIVAVGEEVGGAIVAVGEEVVGVSRGAGSLLWHAVSVNAILNRIAATMISFILIPLKQLQRVRDKDLPLSRLG